MVLYHEIVFLLHPHPSLGTTDHTNPSPLSTSPPYLLPPIPHPPIQFRLHTSIPPYRQLSPHGPGLFVSKHLPDMATTPRRRHNRGKKGPGGKRKQFQGDRCSSSESCPDRRKGGALGEIEWDRAEDIEVLAWDGVAVGGVGLPDPGPKARPIRLTVSGSQ